MAMANYVYYHNARCSKSRQALAFLTENDIQVDIIEYMKAPLKLNEISALFTALGFDSAIDMVRIKEREFATSGISETSSNNEIINAISVYPKLLERPILTDGKNAVIGRPLENIQKLVGL
ncbi:MAG: arsenate reductase [Glaciecola sp.]|jgi:arsenate reductase